MCDLIVIVMPLRDPTLKSEQLYHVYNRGFLRMDLFNTLRDCKKFENKTAYYSKKYSVEIIHYTLMGNHFHFLAKQNKEGGLSKFMQKLLQSFAMYFNIKYQRRGPVFDSRFKAKPVTELEYLRTIESYIANNPVKARIKVCENIASIGFPPELK